MSLTSTLILTTTPLCTFLVGIVPLFSILCHVCEKAAIILVDNILAATAKPDFYLFWFDARKKRHDPDKS